MKELLMDGEIINGKELTKYYPFLSLNDYINALCRMGHPQHKEAMQLKAQRKANRFSQSISEENDEALRRNELIRLYRRGE